MQLLALVVPLFVSALPAYSQEVMLGGLRRADVEAAIERAKANKKEDILELRPPRINVAGTGFTVRIDGPISRIATLANQSFRKYQPFTVDSIPAGMLEPVFSVVATPLDKVTAINMNKQQVTPPATHAVIVVVAEGVERIVQPLATELFDVQVTGMAPGDGYCERNCPPVPMFTTQGIRASFALAEIPASGFELRIVTNEREFRHQVDARRRALIR